ncbi:MAG: bleomycin resistance family protein [Cyanobacteria bacterium P01_C01_bin.118]
MNVKALTPILNVSSLLESIAWFEKLGWNKLWDWGDPPGFGAVGSGECEIFLCQDGQGGRGKGANTSTFGPDGDETQDKGVWMSVWVENVDTVYSLALEANIEVVFPPEDLPWGVRECHLRHPDGHVFRIGQSIATA